MPNVVIGTENVVTHVLPNLSKEKKQTSPLFLLFFPPPFFFRQVRQCMGDYILCAYYHVGHKWWYCFAAEKTVKRHLVSQWEAIPACLSCWTLCWCSWPCRPHCRCSSWHRLSCRSCNGFEKPWGNRCRQSCRLRNQQLLWQRPTALSRGTSWWQTLKKIIVDWNTWHAKSNPAQLYSRTILWKKSVQAAHHDFRFKWKKQMQNEYPHDISVN